MSEDLLKRCPFCGGEAYSFQAAGGAWFVSCNSDRDDKESCFWRQHRPGGMTPEAWNTRPAEAEVSRFKAEAEEARRERDQARSDLAALMEGRATIVNMDGPGGLFPAIMFHETGDPNAEVRDPETGEVIFPAVKAPLRLVQNEEPS